MPQPFFAINVVSAVAILGSERKSDEPIDSTSRYYFSTRKVEFWVSTSPYQLGKFICYDLNVIANPKALKQNHVVYDTAFTIAADTFLGTQQWKDFIRYRELKNEIKKAIKQKAFASSYSKALDEIVQRNPNYWEVYYWVAEYLQASGDKKGAQHYLNWHLPKKSMPKVK